jgi:hypothetical protein
MQFEIRSTSSDNGELTLEEEMNLRQRVRNDGSVGTDRQLSALLEQRNAA